VTNEAQRNEDTVEPLVRRIRSLLIAWREDADAQGENFYVPDGLIRQTRRDVRRECTAELRNALGDYFLEQAGIELPNNRVSGPKAAKE